MSQPTLSARMAALETAIAALVAASTAAPVKAAPVKAAAAAPAAPRSAECACGAAFKRARLDSEIAASPLGLCGLKGLPAHKG